MMCDSGAARSVVTRRFVQQHNLETFSLPSPIHVTGVTAGVEIITTAVTMRIKLRTGRIIKITAYVLPVDEPWAAVVPSSVPPWLKQVENRLADPGLLAAAGRTLSYDALLSGDVLVSLQVVPVLFRKFFALQESLAGIIPRGTYAYGDKASNDAVVRIQRVSARQRDPSPATLEQEERDRHYDELRMLDLERERLVFEGPTTESDVDAANRKEAELQAFLSTIQRADDGRMVVTLPKDPRYKDLITRNSWSANRRLQSTLKAMKEDPVIRDGLTQTKEYMVCEGVLKLTSVDELDRVAAEKGRPWTELSFRGVLRPESKTTPVRLVISGDNKDIGGKSTNDWFDSGVNVLPHIPQVITHLRMHKQFILTDLKKAFYQIALSEEDRDLLVFKWPNLKEDGSVEYEYYSFQRLAMGIMPAPAELNGCSVQFQFKHRVLFNPHACVNHRANG
jgi:hypothetical protein